MADRDWADARYVRVYRSLLRDHPAVLDDVRLTGAWLQALLAADGAWPGAAELPRPLTDDDVSALELEGVLVRHGAYRFRFKGLDAEREAQRVQSEWHRAGGRARATGPRDPAGRLLGQQGRRLNGGDVSSSLLGGPAGPAAPAPTNPSSSTGPTGPRTTTDQQPASPAAPAGAGEPDGYTCRDPENHASPPRYTPGVGWWCPDCQADDAQRDAKAGESFRSKAQRHGARDA